jgi:hypothetical protein
MPLAEGFCDLGESFWPRASMIGGGGPCLFFQSYPRICLTTEEKHGKRQSVELCTKIKMGCALSVRQYALHDVVLRTMAT